MSEQSIRDILNKYSQKHAEMVEKEQEKLILEGCAICGVDLMDISNNTILNDAVLIQDYASIFLSVPVCGRCRDKIITPVVLRQNNPLWVLRIPDMNSKG